MKIYKIANKFNFNEDDKITATYKGKQYTGNISEYLPEENQYYITFDLYEELAKQPSNKMPNEMYNEICDIIEWMEKPLNENELKLVKPAKLWQNVKSKMDFNLIKEEIFYYGARAWDVREAKRIIEENPRPTIEFPVNSVKYYITSGQIATFEKYSKEANIKNPIILISINNEHDNNINHFPIDGWHRIKKAIELNTKTLPAYTLTTEETKQIDEKL